MYQTLLETCVLGAWLSSELMCWYLHFARLEYTYNRADKGMLPHTRSSTFFSTERPLHRLRRATRSAPEPFRIPRLSYECATSLRLEDPGRVSLGTKILLQSKHSARTPGCKLYFVSVRRLGALIGAEHLVQPAQAGGWQRAQRRRPQFLM